MGISQKIKIEGKNYRLPEGWMLMTPKQLASWSGIPLEKVYELFYPNEKMPAAK